MKMGKLFALLMMMGLAGCQTFSGPKEGIGTLTGAVAGGIIGNQVGGGDGKVIATATGAVIGALAGGAIGAMMDDNDRRKALEAQAEALEFHRSGSAVSWNNPDTGHRGFIVPKEAHMNNGRVCRAYTETIFIDERPEVAHGQACRDLDGTWKIIR